MMVTYFGLIITQHLQNKIEEYRVNAQYQYNITFEVAWVIRQPVDVIDVEIEGFLIVI